MDAFCLKAGIHGIKAPPVDVAGNVELRISAAAADKPSASAPPRNFSWGFTFRRPLRSFWPGSKVRLESAIAADDAVLVNQRIIKSFRPLTTQLAATQTLEPVTALPRFLGLKFISIMAGPNTQKAEVDAMDNEEIKIHKNHKNKQKRKLEQTDAEFVAEAKKDVENENIGEPAKTLNGSRKKKKNLKEDEVLDAGPVEISKKKKKKNEEGQGEDGVSEKEKIASKFGQNTKDEVIESSSGVVVSGKNVNESKYKPLDSFDESGLSGEVLDCCKAIDKPSPIQSHAWPFLVLSELRPLGLVKRSHLESLLLGTC